MADIQVKYCKKATISLLREEVIWQPKRHANFRYWKTRGGFWSKGVIVSELKYAGYSSTTIEMALMQLRSESIVLIENSGYRINPEKITLLPHDSS